MENGDTNSTPQTINKENISKNTTISNTSPPKMNKENPNYYFNSIPQVLYKNDNGTPSEYDYKEYNSNNTSSDMGYISSNTSNTLSNTEKILKLLHLIEKKRKLVNFENSDHITKKQKTVLLEDNIDQNNSNQNVYSYNSYPTSHQDNVYPDYQNYYKSYITPYLGYINNTVTNSTTLIQSPDNSRQEDTRNKILKKFVDLFSTEKDSKKAKAKAEALERLLYENIEFSEYRKKARTIYSNLKDNNMLVGRILNNEITLEKLIEMDLDDLSNPEEKEKRQQLISKKMKEKFVVPPESTISLYSCPVCQGNEATMSQTPNGQKTFYKCSKCGHTWDK